MGKNCQDPAMLQMHCALSGKTSYFCARTAEIDSHLAIEHYILYGYPVVDRCWLTIWPIWLGRRMKKSCQDPAMLQMHCAISGKTSYFWARTAGIDSH